MRARIEQRGALPGTGPPLVLLPGAAAEAALWDAVVDELAPRRRLHLVSVAGFAGVPAPEGPLFPGLVDELVEHVAGLEAPVLVGHSFGAFVAWRVMRRCPGVRGVVAVDSIPAVGEAIAGPEEIVAEADHRAERMAQADDLVAVLAPSILAMTFDPRHVERLLDAARGTSPRILAEAMRRLWTTDLRAELALDPRPTLLVLPGDEHLDEPRRAQKHSLARAQLRDLPNHRVVVLERAGHYLMLDRPLALARELAGFAVG